MNKNMNTLKLIIFFGALWGIFEATLGYVLHFIPVPFVAGSIMFPFAALILLKAYKSLESKKALLGVGAVAASIKALNFFMPVFIWKVANPMASIIFETLMIVGVASLMVSRKPAIQVSAFVGTSMAWRALFLGWYAMQYVTTGFLADQISSLATMLSFTVLQGAFSGVLAFGLFIGFEAVQKRLSFNLRINMASALIALIIAISLTIAPL